VVATGSGALANAAGERLKGIEAETRYQITTDLALAANCVLSRRELYAVSFFRWRLDRRCRRQATPPVAARSCRDGIALYASSRSILRQPLQDTLAAAFLDEENTAPVGGYMTLDANLGYRIGPYQATLEATNLTNQRPPVTSSEFGSQSFYLLPARMTWIRFKYAWR